SRRKIIVEYVWIGGTGQGQRSKFRTISKIRYSLPLIAWRPSSTGHAPGGGLEVMLDPRQSLPTPSERAKSVRLSVTL
ncbi:unnamed protein product, partial [Discosporangium mesarthrocarpum]